MKKLIFLGTGSAVCLTRQLTSLCFVVDGKAFLIDCGDGMGTVRQLARAGVKLEDINDIFVTHRHADHIIGLPQLLLNKLLGDNNQVKIYGPRDALETVKLVCFQTHDYIERNSDRVEFISLEQGQEIVIFDKVRIKNAKIKTDEASPMTVFAYSVVINKKKIVFTSDMQPNKNFDFLAKNADILIHECHGFAIKKPHIHNKGHSTAQDAGIAAQKAGAKQLILTHLNISENDPEGEKYLQEAAKFFKGKITLAKDLLEIPLNG